MIFIIGQGQGQVQAAALASIVVDAKTGETISQSNPDAPHAPASLTKMMTLYIVFDLIEQKRVSYATKILITEHAANQAPSNLEMKAGQTLTLKDAVLALITKSANDVAAAIGENLAGSEAKFAKIMTWKAHQMGMTATTFKNASGLPDPEQMTTARDMATLGLRLVHDFPEHYKLFSTRTFTFNGETHRNHNTLLFTYEGTDGIKTGYTQASGFNLVTSVRRENRHVIGVVLGGSTAVHRNITMRGLLSAGIAKARALEKSLLAMRPSFLARKPKTPASVPDVTPVAEANAAVAQPQKFAVAPGKSLKREAALAPTAGNQTSSGTLIPASAGILPKQPTGQPAGLGAASTGRVAGPYHIQVGAFATAAEAARRLVEVSGRAPALLGGHPPGTMTAIVSGTQYHRARFGGFDEAQARATCLSLKQYQIDCVAMRAE